ncbi:hypothetical protein [Streptomyces ardesiacus]|uniref:hypothetical protein n=1 Tax=Streptomyces ardesiacus TaxID=285564 RepID=UPI002FDC357F
MSEAVNPAELPEDENHSSEKPEVRVWPIQDEPPEVPTSGASVSITIEKLGVEAAIEVPAGNADQLITISPLLLGMVSSLGGPIILLQVTASLEMHWSAKFALALLLAIIPMVYVLLSNRRYNV